MDTPLNKVWSHAQASIRKLVSRKYYRLWFANLRPREINSGEAVLEVADDFSELWLKENYLGLLEDVLCQATGRPLEVRFVVTGHPAESPRPEAREAEPEPESLAERPVSPARAGGPAFNPRYTFETFVVGSNNNFAHAASLAVAQAPGKSYNPLFVYGVTGLGKTHLLHAIGHEALRQRRHVRITLLSSERFTNEYIDAIQTHDVARFRRKYRQADFLLIDDVQFLANKERIQEEFFHTFNALHEAHKQLVLTCDQPPAEMKEVEQRLVSRFEWGLVADLQPPDFETRLAILRKWQRSSEARIADDVIELLATRIRSNVRRLEGAVLRLGSYASLTGRDVTREEAERVLREVLYEEGNRSVNVDSIQRRVAEHYDIRIADMTSKRRPENIAFPRQIAMYLSRELTENSLSVIGDCFGGRDHGTVMHACKVVRDRMEVDAHVRQTVEHLRRQLHK